MNAIGIALVWCVVQVTLIGMLAGGLYLLARWLRPAAAAPIALTGLATPCGNKTGLFCGRRARFFPPVPLF